MVSGVKRLKTFTAEGAENAEFFLFKAKGSNKRLSPQRAQRTQRALF